MKKVFFIVFAVCLAAISHAQFLYVNAPSGVRLRETPDLQGKVLGTVPYSAQIEVVKKGVIASKSYTIEGKKGKFIKVKYNKKEGYVFDALLLDYSPKPLEVKIYAIAVSGLRLRDKPDANSAVLATIPFGDSLNSDGTLGSVWEKKEQSPKEVFEVDGVEGFFQKVKYKGKKGYVFSGFVAEYYKPAIEKKPYLILEEGWSCGNIPYNLSDYNWFGWYANRNKTELKPVAKISFAMTLSDEMSALYTRTDRTAKGDTAVYIIGVRKTQAQNLKAGAFKGSWNQETMYNEDFQLAVHKDRLSCTFDKNQGELELGLTPAPPNSDRGWDYSNSSLTYRKGQQQQVLHTFDEKKDYSDSNLWFMGATVLWSGDVDGDGKMDMILQLEAEVGGVRCFYLSSAAKKGELFGLVGMLFGCGC